jgi:hypothetical protein
VRNGVSGWVCADLDEMTRRAVRPDIPPLSCRRDAERRFSVERMAADYEAVYIAAVTGAPVGAAVAQPAAGS